MMGCGKTYIGQILATKLNAQFIDTDDLIEKEEGTIISDIFTNKGESYFRRCEALAFERAMQDRTAVISTGGGLLTTPSTVGIMKQHSISIWLRSDIEDILTRLEGDITRPLLQVDSPEDELRRLLKNREALYSKADIHIHNKDEANNVVETIVQKLKGT